VCCWLDGRSFRGVDACLLVGFFRVHVVKVRFSNIRSLLQVVLNCNVTSLCKYKKKSEDFHKFQDEMGTIFGFGFYKKEESIEEASA